MDANNCQYKDRVINAHNVLIFVFALIVIKQNSIFTR